MFFHGWSELGRILVVGALAYLALIVLLRISGKRTLAKFNAFDFVVTVALGSTLATVLLDSSISLAEGVVAFALLIILQFVISWLSVRSSHVREWTKSEPVLLAWHGTILDEALMAQRLSRDELFAALRSNGNARIEEVGAVVLETDGTISILPGKPHRGDSALDTVHGMEHTCDQARQRPHQAVEPQEEPDPR